jgi:hypothetical protein
MAKISDVDVTSLLFQEGSAPATPAATKWRAYFKTSGLFYKDDAGTETGPLAASGALPSGTSFPGGPSTNDLYFRTDRGLVYFYDGTRWLSWSLFSVAVPSTRAVLPLSSSNSLDVGVPYAGTYALWLEDLQVTFFVNGGTALGASHKWVCVLTNTPTATVLQTATIDSGASNAWRSSGFLTIDSVQATTEFGFGVTATKTGTPGTLYVLPTIMYRLVG